MSLITVTLTLDENEVSLIEARAKALRKSRGLIIDECLELYIYEEIIDASNDLGGEKDTQPPLALRANCNV